MTTDWALRGPLPARHARIDDWCTLDGDAVAVTVHHPASVSKARGPAVVFCHGLGSGRDEYGVVGAQLASHGFASIHVEFEDSFVQLRDRLGIGHLTSATWSADPGARAAILPLLFDPRQWLSRVERVAGVIDAIKAHTVPGLSAGPVLVAGHSYGAFTAQMLAGVHVSDPALASKEFRHPSVVAAALLSPQGSGTRGLSETAWDNLTLPLLEVTATHDLGPNGEGLPWRTEPYRSTPVRDKWLMVVLGGDHGLGGIAYHDSSVPPPDVVAQVAGSIVAFAAWMGGDAAGGQWLDAGHRPDLIRYASGRSQA